jgi:CBS domain containing-hemolysin-like protein
LIDKARDKKRGTKWEIMNRRDFLVAVVSRGRESVSTAQQATGEAAQSSLLRASATRVGIFYDRTHLTQA